MHRKSISLLKTSRKFASLLVEMLTECQTAWIWMNHRVTPRLIRIKDVRMWHHGRAYQAKRLMEMSEIFTIVNEVVIVICQ